MGGAGSAKLSYQFGCSCFSFSISCFLWIVRKFYDITKINDNSKQDDLIALLIANKRKSEENIAKWILQSGSLPSECIKDFERVFISGLSEVEVFLRSEGVI